MKVYSRVVPHLTSGVHVLRDACVSSGLKMANVLQESIIIEQLCVFVCL
jgi:hypothetical protein